MDIWRTVLEIGIAVLAVAGFYGILRGVGESFFLPKQVTAAVVIRGRVDASELDILLSEAQRYPARRRGQRVVLLLPADVVNRDADEEAHRLVDIWHAVAAKYNAEVYAVTFEEDDFL